MWHENTAATMVTLEGAIQANTVEDIVFFVLSAGML